jgi:mono/diheme cytochrome c family protein
MRYAYYSLAFMVVLLLSVMGFRGMTSPRPPIEIWPDMDHQAKYKPQAESKFFADGRADRPIPAGAVPFGRSSQAGDPAFLRADDAHYAGTNADGSFLRGFPAGIEVTREFVTKGQNRYQIYCAPCHGTLGDGNGITKSYGMVATPTYHDDRLRSMAEGELYNTITHGKNTMFPYADKLSPDERWAVIAYVRALQRAHHATIDDVPLEQRGGLK